MSHRILKTLGIIAIFILLTCIARAGDLSINTTEYEIAHPDEAAEIYAKWENANVSMIKHSINVSDMHWVHDPHLKIESVEGANVFYVKPKDTIEKIGRDVVVINVTAPTAKPTLLRLTSTPLPVAGPTPRPTPTPIPIPVATPPPVLPISPEYFYIIPIALFLILLPLIYYARGKRKKPAKTSEKSLPPSLEQKVKKEQISPQISESTTIERAIYDPCKRDFIERRLPRMKEWINRYDPGAYWFVISIQNNTDRAIEEWGVELETSSALKIREARVEGIDYKIELRETYPEPYKNVYAIGVPKEYGIVIPKGGAQRVYFKLRADKPKTVYEISGVFKSAIGDVPIRAKEFKYLCDAGASPEAVKAELKKTFPEKDAVRLANAFRIAQEIRSSYCNTDTKASEISKEFDILKMYLSEKEFLDEVEGIQRRINAELREDERLDDKHVEEVKDFCDKFTEMWIAKFLR